MTMARWMRQFVTKHPEYKQDSVITDKINYDLIRQCDTIARGQEQCPELIGDPINRGIWKCWTCQKSIFWYEYRQPKSFTRHRDVFQVRCYVRIWNASLGQIFVECVCVCVYKIIMNLKLF